MPFAFSAQTIVNDSWHTVPTVGKRDKFVAHMQIFQAYVKIKKQIAQNNKKLAQLVPCYCPKVDAWLVMEKDAVLSQLISDKS